MIARADSRRADPGAHGYGRSAPGDFSAPGRRQTFSAPYGEKLSPNPAHPPIPVCCVSVVQHPIRNTHGKGYAGDLLRVDQTSNHPSTTTTSGITATCAKKVPRERAECHLLVPDHDEPNVVPGNDPRVAPEVGPDRDRPEPDLIPGQDRARYPGRQRSEKQPSPRESHGDSALLHREHDGQDDDKECQHYENARRDPVDVDHRERQRVRPPTLDPVKAQAPIRPVVPNEVQPGHQEHEERNPRGQERPPQQLRQGRDANFIARRSPRHSPCPTTPQLEHPVAHRRDQRGVSVCCVSVVQHPIRNTRRQVFSPQPEHVRARPRRAAQGHGRGRLRRASS